MTAPLAPWDRARLSARLLAVDPGGLGGLWLRARSGPVRQRFLDAIEDAGLPDRRIHPATDDIALFGGLDIAATLAEGRSVDRPGLLAQPARLTLTMAERCPVGLAARLATALDSGGHALLALDEGAEPDETIPPALADRMAFFACLDGVSLADCDAFLRPTEVAEARVTLPRVTIPDEIRDELTGASAALGIGSLRAPLFAIRAARALAALSGRNRVDSDDARLAAALVFAHRATLAPEDDASDEPDPPEPPQEEMQEETFEIPEELLLDAVRAALPPDVLAMLAAGRSTVRSSGAGSGARRRGNRRGRPMPPRQGRPDGTSRIDLVATLRAAAPWQTVRGATAIVPRPIHIRPSDLHLARYEELSDRLLIFAVDASGSAAVARLAEAKGAVEMLLAEAYARRDHVALVAFRGTEAEELLPPTRSLVQTKRRLAGLPGGGATPLAHGLRAAMEIARAARARGMSPNVVLLTDGRANVALDGTANRAAAAEDARRTARALRQSGTPALVVDTAARPQESLVELAAILDAPYLPLPRADAARLTRAVSDALGD